MAAAANGHDYKEFLVFLTTAGVIAPLFNRLKVNPILGFLIAGVALGPQGLGRFTGEVPAIEWVTFGRPEDLAPLGELGVVFLLFMIGLELSWARLKTLRRLVFGLGFLQIAVCGAAIGWGASMLGQPPVAAALIGLGLALSSTALVIPAFADRKRLTTPAGRASLAILLAQDLAVAPILVSIDVLGDLHGGGAWTNALLALGPAVLGLAILVLAGRLLLRPLFHSAALARSPDMFVAASLLIVVGAAAAAQAIGLSMALGAFVAGLLLAETEFRREIEVVIEPYKGLLLGMFFVSLGAGMNLNALFASPGLILGLTAGVMALKAAAVYGLGRLFRLSVPAAAEAALPLGPAGEFAFVVAAQAGAAGLLGAHIAEAVVVSCTLGLFLIPALAGLSGRLIPRAPPPGAGIAPIPEGDTPGGRVLVVGYGRVGRLVGEMMRVHEIGFTAIDSDPNVVSSARGGGARLYFGDAGREAFLVACGVETAPAVVVTMDAAAKVNEVVRTVRALRPDVTLIARARDARHAQELYRLGVTDAVPEAIEASLQLAENTLVDLGVPMGLVIASIHEKRDELRKLISEDAAAARPLRAFRRPSQVLRAD